MPMTNDAYAWAPPVLKEICVWLGSIRETSVFCPESALQSAYLNRRNGKKGGRAGGEGGMASEFSLIYSAWSLVRCQDDVDFDVLFFISVTMNTHVHASITSVRSSDNP